MPIKTYILSKRLTTITDNKIEYTKNTTIKCPASPLLHLGATIKQKNDFLNRSAELSQQ
jgi:hypothetical protein